MLNFNGVGRKSVTGYINAHIEAGNATEPILSREKPVVNSSFVNCWCDRQIWLGASAGKYGGKSLVDQADKWLKGLISAWLTNAGFWTLNGMACPPEDRPIWSFDNDGFAGEVAGAINSFNPNVGISPIELPVLWECKIFTHKQFMKVKEKGIEKEHPDFYANVQCVMLNTNQKRTLFTSVNRNDMSMCHEIINLDRAYAASLEVKARKILAYFKGNNLPKKGTDRDDYYKCNECEFSFCCFGERDDSL